MDAAQRDDGDWTLDGGVEEQSERLLEQLVEESAASFAALISTTGSVLAMAGTPASGRGKEVGWEHTTAALAAGAYCATAELHRHLGGESGDAFYHGDEALGLFIRPLRKEDLLLLVSFGQATTAGVVRLSLDRILPAFQALLAGGIHDTDRPLPKIDFPLGLSVVVKDEGAAEVDLE